MFSRRFFLAAARWSERLQATGTGASRLLTPGVVLVPEDPTLAHYASEPGEPG
jgi:hypothetical protein